MNLSTGNRLGPYEIVAPLGAGGMGEVYRARDVRLERDVGSISSCPIMARLDPELHPLLDHAPHAPRRMDATLVWPLEAPMIDRGRFRLFREVKIESGLPEGTDLR